MSGRFTSKSTRLVNLLGLLGLALLVAALLVTTAGTSPVAPLDAGPDKSIASINTESLKTGDLAFRRQPGLISELARQLSPKEQRFSHVGVVLVNDKGVEVVHAVSDETRGFNGVVIEDLNAFFEESRDWSFYRLSLSANQRLRIAASARDAARVQTPFDDYFDLASNDRLYCTEFVAKVLNAVLNQPLFETSFTPGGRPYLPLDALYLNSGVMPLTP